MARLSALGFLSVEPIHRGWQTLGPAGHLIDPKTHKKPLRSAVLAIAKEKVSGDIKALCPGGGGVAVHVEVKSMKEDKLGYGSLRPHQVEALDQQFQRGAIALLVWVREDPDSPTGWGCCVLQWPVSGMVKKKSRISWSDAKLLSLQEAPRFTRVRQVVGR